MNKIIALCLAWIIVLYPTAGLAKAAPIEKQSRETIEKMTDELIAFLSEKTRTQSEIQKKLEKVMDQYFDMPRIAKFVLGPTYWRAATPAQQKEYSRLFESYVVNTYTKNFKEYNGQKITFQDVKANENQAVVRTLLTDNTSPEAVVIDWRLSQVSGKMKITDVIIEGVSMSLTQRSDFASVIERNGGSIDALLETLRAKENLPENKRI